ncbi:DUF6714 family protein [Luteolibacter sp. AS25]|uniref:DUF6714 family protein n=1 Tax=Luteolibacter sp. AS25 TaxID=3135776 RepID=UPI00398B7D07
MKTSPPDESTMTAPDSSDLRSRIRAAFKGVTLGGGVGLYEAQGIDDHDSAEVCQRYRENDEKDSWERITSDDLNHCYSSLSFFDAEGMRFHIPAYLLADLNGEYKFDMLFEFTNWCDLKREQYSLLSTAQRSVVMDYLRFMQDRPGNWLDVHKIDFTLDTFCEVDPDSTETKKHNKSEMATPRKPSD